MRATRESIGGERDPHGDAKDSAERRLYRLLRSRLNGQLDEVMDLLGDPPNLNKLDAAFWASTQGQMIADLRPQLERMARESIATTAATVPILWDEAVIAGEVVDWAQQYTYDLVTGLNSNTQRLLQRVVPGFAETPGMTVADLRDELTPAFGEARARTIATTEVTRAYAHGTDIIQRQLAAGGVEMERVWHTSGDDRVCEICGPLDGMPESEWAQASPNAQTPPPAHPNCRCWTTLRSKR